MHENGDFWSGLAGFGTAPALICGDDILTYAQLAAQADAQIADMRAAIPLDITRPLVAIEAVDSFAAIIAYLACLRAGWPVLLMAPDDARIVAMFRPNYRFGQGALASDAAVMHPDLALLLPTSGSTGLPKLVRLSRRNIASNAAAIVDYLQISASDRALMALPWHYSYGLSVLHTHLLAGAALVLSPHRVDNAAFWHLAKGQGITTLALVPTQFDLIEKHDFVHELPKTLRYLTCAGGRLQPARAALFAKICPLVLNYGATEASPRMAWLPPKDFAAFPDSNGRPIPGGHLALEAGELVFKGPGVMLGYAESRKNWRIQPGRTGCIPAIWPRYCPMDISASPVAKAASSNPVASGWDWMK